MKRMLLACLALAGCASTETVTPMIGTDGRETYRTMRIAQPIEFGTERIPPQTLRNTIRSGDADVFIGDVGGLTWPYTGAPLPNYGLCVKASDPSWFGFYTPSLPGCIEIDGIVPPITVEPR